MHSNVGIRKKNFIMKTQTIYYVVLSYRSVNKFAMIKINSFNDIGNRKIKTTKTYEFRLC